MDLVRKGMLFVVFLLLGLHPLYAAIPTITISLPANNASFDAGNFVNFVGTATDPDGKAITTYQWSSSRDGVLGATPSIGTDKLSIGSHTITFLATDEDNETNSAQIFITVANTPPVVSITSPAGGSTHKSNDFIVFRGVANDPQDGLLTGSLLVWTSSQNGNFGTGEQVETDKLNVGAHTITFTATDKNGASSAASISITVENTPPTAVIAKPTDGDTFDTSHHISFEGRGTDAEDGAITDDTLRWISDRDGLMGTGPNITTDTLSPGNHEISLTVTDSDGVTSPAATIDITINNTGPTAQITSPPNNSNFNAGAIITFTGTGSDAQDPSIPDSSFAWSSDKDGNIGTGRQLTLSSLSEGRHVITLTVRDSDGETGTASIQIVAGNNPPVASIRTPQDGTKFQDGIAILFSGVGIDKEDGTLSGDSLVWTSDIDGEIGKGTTFSKSDLKAGLHHITLTATDKEGTSHATSISIVTGNIPPTTPVIHKPVAGGTFERGTPIIFHGSASDAEDGQLTGASLKWVTNNGGLIQEFHSGESFSYDQLASGEQIITLIATDSGGATSETDITITVNEMKSDTPQPRLERENILVVNVVGGTGPYRISNRYPQIAETRVTQETANAFSFSIQGISEGSTTLTVTDNVRNAISLPVLVTPSTNQAPTANATPTPGLVAEGEQIELSARNSEDSDGNITAFRWEQTHGPSVLLHDPTLKTLSFMAPAVSHQTSLTFRLTVTDNDGAMDATTTTVSVIDNDVTMENIPATALPVRSHSGPPVAILVTEGLLRFDATDPKTIQEPVNRPTGFPYGLFDMEKQVADGAQAQFHIYLPEPAPKDAKWMKYVPQKGWIDFDRSRLNDSAGDGAYFYSDRRQVRLSITDNGPYDDNPAPGIVRDPSGVGTFGSQTQTSGGGGGGGCFIRSLP